MAFDYTNYYELDYIESTGTQYIDTGLNSADGYEYEISGRFTQLSTSANNGLVGRTQSNRHDYFNVRTNANAYCGIGSPETQITTMVAGTDYIIKWRSLADNRYCSVNDTSVSISGTNTVSTNNAYLFCYNHISSGASAFSSFRLYYFDVKDANGYVRKFRPAQRKSDGAFGLYDTVNETFYTNAGTGSFIAFDKVNYEQGEYIESDGTAYINTNHKPNRYTVVEGRFKTPNKTGYLFGVNSNGGTTGYYDVTNDLSYDRYSCRLVTSSNNAVSPQFSGEALLDVYCNPKVEIRITDGTSTISRSINITNTSTASRPMYLLARNNEGSVSGRVDGNRLYYCNITNHNTGATINTYVPAKRRSDGVVGLYDIKNNAFVTPPSGAFRFGAIASPVYVKVNGAWKKGIPYIKVNGAWKQGKPFVKVSGNWEVGV